jgi:hypothetical protein
MNKLLLLALVISILLIPVLGVSNTTQRAPQPIRDCSYLITILEKIINYTIVLDNKGEYMARVMRETPVDTSLQDLHRKTYNFILDYYKALSTVTPPVEVLRDLLRRAYVVQEYTRKLQSCSRGVEATGAHIGRILDTLESQLETLVMLYSESSGLITIDMLEKVYEPGEEAPLRVYINETCSIASILLVFKDFIIKTINFTCSGKECSTTFRIPSASSVQNIVEGDIVKYFIAIRAICEGRELKVYRFIEVKYEYPQITIDAPYTIVSGEFFNITIHAVSELNLTGILLVKNAKGEFPLRNITITNTPQVYQLHVNKSLFTIGANTLKICVNASEKTLPYCFERRIIVQPKYPSVNIKTTLTSTTWMGNIPIYITSESGEYTAYIYLNGVLVAESRVTNTSTITVSSGVLPLSVLNLTVIIRDPNNVYDDYTYSTMITSINMSTLLATLFAGSALIAILREHEKSFILMLRTGRAHVTREVKSEVPGVLKDILKPYVFKSKSHILDFYYILLRKLGMRLPHHYETLREHYSEIVESHTKKSHVRKLLRRLLILTERDLYSIRKPRLEEAEELYKGVLNATKET